MKSMKLKTLTTLIIGVCFTPLLVKAQNEEQQTISFDNPLTLEECVQYGLENNYNLKTDRLEEKIAETQVGETRAMGLPQANFQSGLNYNYEVQKAFLPNAILTGDPQAEGFTPVQFSPQYDGNAAFSVSQLLFDGSYFVGLQAAKTLRELRQKESNRTEIDIVESITKSYYLVLITEERAKLVGANLSRLEKVLSDTKALRKNGFAEQLDVDKLQVNLNNLKTEMNKVERNLTYTKDVLKFQMGLPLENQVILSGTLEELNLDASEYLGVEAEFDVNLRPEYNILQTNQDLANLDLKNNKATHLPQLYANFSYGWNSGVNSTNDLFNFNENWLSFGAVGVSLKWSLFTGLARSNRMERNRIQIEQLEIQKTSLRNSIDMEIKQAKDNLKSATEALEVQKGNMELSKEVFEQMEIKFKNGVASSTELLEAETSTKEAQTNYYSALYDAVLSKIELEKALGILY
jgi:outer membrane protein